MSTLDLQDYTVVLHYNQEKVSASDALLSAANAVRAIEQTDKILIKSASRSLEASFRLEELGTGSIKIRFLLKIAKLVDSIDDEALKKLDWKEILGSYLVKAKRVLLEFAHENNGVSDGDQLVSLKKKINSLADQSEIRLLPQYSPLKTKEIYEGLGAFSSSLGWSKYSDSRVSLIIEGDEIELSKEFQVDTRDSNALIVETIVTEQEMVLRIGRPNFQRFRSWEFLHGSKRITAHIKDPVWIKRFRRGDVAVTPETIFRAILKREISYSEEGDIVKEEKTILRIGLKEEKHGESTP